MKTLLITICLFVASVAFAEEDVWYPVGKADVNTYYPGNSGKAACDADHAPAKCYNIKGKDPRYHKVESTQQDDITKPIYKPKYNIENCATETECQTDMAQKTDCNNGDTPLFEKNTLPIPGYSLFCTGVTGYEQITVETVVEDATKKPGILAADAAAKAQQDAVLLVAKDASFGNRMIAFISSRVRQKNLNLADTKTTLSEYGALISLLRAGSIAHAKSEAESVTPDGTRITQADKDALLAEINSYLGL